MPPKKVKINNETDKESKKAKKAPAKKAPAKKVPAKRYVKRVDLYKAAQQIKKASGQCKGLSGMSKTQLTDYIVKQSKAKNAIQLGANLQAHIANPIGYSGK